MYVLALHSRASCLSLPFLACPIEKIDRIAMAFVAFGRKKVISAQQRQQQQQQQQDQEQLSRSHEQFTTAAKSSTYQQEHNSIAQSDLEGFRMADADTVHRDGPGVGVGVDALFCYRPPADAQKEQLLEADGGGGISQLIEHNNALRRNFDNLKQLHLQLAEANAQLQEAFLTMQAEKARVEGELTHHSAMQHEREVLEAELEEMKSKHAKELNRMRAEREEISSLAVDLEQRNRCLEKKVALVKGDNKELNQKLDVVRYGHDVDGSVSTQMLRLEKDDALTSKHAAELQYARELSLVKVDDQNFRQQAADLAHKVLLIDITVSSALEQCKHLEIDLEKAISAGEAVHQELVALTYEKDAMIMDLEQALRRLKEEYKLNFRIQEEANQKLKESLNEILELRTSLNTLEKSSAAAEAQHLNTLKDLNKECDTLRKELGAALAAQKEAADRVIEMERIRVQLGDALDQNHESVCLITEYRKVKDDLDRKMELLRLELAEAVAARGKEQAEHMRELEKYQRSWAEEKSALQKREDTLVKAVKKEFRCKYRALKKRSKRTSKLLATMTADHNQLIIRSRECEAQLAIAQTTRFQPTVGIPSSVERTPLKVDAFRSGFFEADMKELGDRQAKFSIVA